MIFQLEGSKIPAEFSRGFGVDGGVFAYVFGGLVGAEHYVWWVECEVGELGVRG